MPHPTQSYVTTLEQVDRVEHLDADGGGFIVRTLYCEPYTSYPFVELALKGTVVKLDDNVSYARVLPHADPVKNWFYCSDVKVVPFAREAIRGARSTGFVPSRDLSLAQTPAPGSQQGNLAKALDNIDDFDFAANPDTLSIEEIVAGGPNYPADGNAFESKGNCGAFITATYTPLIFIPGTRNTSAGKWQGPGDGTGFDFVDPTWTPVQKNTQIGRSLRILTKILGGNMATDGIEDTVCVPETLYELSFRRLMVPQLPLKTFGYYPNRINSQPLVVSSQYTFPPQTVRMEMPQPKFQLTPDNKTVYEVRIAMTVRVIVDESYNPDTKAFGDVDRITWNQQLCLPNAAILGFLGLAEIKLGYYPIGWIAGKFPIYGPFRGVYRLDNEPSNDPANDTQKTLLDMVSLGFKEGQ